VETEHDFDRVYREAGPSLWRALYAFSGGRRDIAEEALAEGFARHGKDLLGRNDSCLREIAVASKDAVLAPTQRPSRSFPRRTASDNPAP
jgi:hypothetical protein